MRLESVKTSDGQGYQLSIHGSAYSKHFKKQVDDTLATLKNRFHRVSHKSQKKNDIEYHVYRVYGDKKYEQVGGGLYFTYGNGMTDMSCYIVAHLQNSRKRNNLWNFIAEERDEARKYCTNPIVPHMTLYECHINCGLFQCPANMFIKQRHSSWIEELAINLLRPTHQFLTNLSFVVADTGRYDVFGKQTGNQYIAMILQLISNTRVTPDRYVENYRLLMRQVLTRLMGHGYLHECTSKKGDAEFSVLCDQHGGEIVAIPPYHTQRFVPHVSLGTINRPFDPPTNLRAFDYAHNPVVATIPDDIRYIEISFKNARLSFFYHCVYDIVTGSVYHLDNSEYPVFATNALDTIS
jgi:hypothetical protein